MAENQAAAGNIAGLMPQYSPENMEKHRADMARAATRDLRLRCLELACRTHGSSMTPDEIVAAAEKYHVAVNS